MTNDKAIITFDTTVESIKYDSQYTETPYKSKSKDGTALPVKGNWLVVDNGYHEVMSVDS